MKQSSLLLLMLSLATLYSSQMSNEDRNKINEEKAKKSSTYIHGKKTDNNATIKKAQYKDLKIPLQYLYKYGTARCYYNIKATLENPEDQCHYRHITTPPPVYFIIGPTGAGKSTSIFALQGNDVAKNKKLLGKLSISSDEDPNRSEEEVDDTESEVSEGDTWESIGGLKIRKTIKLPTPEVAFSLKGVTKGTKIYYTGKKIEKPMAFCDTEGFLGEREIDNDIDRFIATFSLSFALKANKIGGIVFLVSADDITSGRGNVFHKSVRFLTQYFDIAVLEQNLAILKKSFMLLITKEKGDEKERSEGLVGIIKAAYRDYYQGLSYEKNQVQDVEDNHNDSLQKEEKEDRIGQLKPFFSLLLKRDVKEDEIDTITYKFLDSKNVRFFYPYQAKNREKIRTKLLNLRPLDLRFLSLQNDQNTLQVIEKIMGRVSAINNISHKVLEYNNLVQLQKLFSKQKKNNNKLQVLVQGLIERSKQLEQVNHSLIHSAASKRIHQFRHQASVPLARKGGYKKYVEKKTSSWSWFWKPFKYLYYDYVRYHYEGYLAKKVAFSIDSPVYTIKIVTKHKGEIMWVVPKHSFMQKNFKKKSLEQNKKRTMVVLEAKDKKGAMQDQWEICHKTAYEEDADCCITFFSQENRIKANNLKIEDNEKTIQRINMLFLEKSSFQDPLHRILSHSMLSFFHKNVKETSSIKETENLYELQEEMHMISFFGNHIFEEGKKASKELINQYMENYNEALTSIDLLATDNTNAKHSDYQPGEPRLLKDDEEQKDDDNHNTSSDSSLDSVVKLSITGLLASLLKEN